MSRRAQVRKEPLREAIHHLAQYMTFIAPMSRKTESQARSREEALATRLGFMSMLERIESAACQIADDLDDEDVSRELERVMDELHRLPQWKRAMDAKNARDRTFTKIRDATSTNHPEHKCFEVALTRDCEVFGDWLLGFLAFVDGTPWYVIGVEWSELSKPFKVGTPIRIVVISPEEAREENRPNAQEAQAQDSQDSGKDPGRVAVREGDQGMEDKAGSGSNAGDEHCSTSTDIAGAPPESICPTDRTQGEGPRQDHDRRQRDPTDRRSAYAGDNSP